MKSLILVVDDNVDLLLNISMIFEFNDYDVITAHNGKEGLDILSKMDHPPDLIISDIMMPIMDGYEFFDNVSKDIRWGTIPFLFLSAKGSSSDVRFGKMLGADDYIIKPFDQEDLIAAVSGKLSRMKKINTLNQKIVEMLSIIPDKDKTSHNYSEEKDLSYLLMVLWDDKLGPKLFNHYPMTENISISLDEIGNQLFSCSESIYGCGFNIKNADGLLMNIENIGYQGYLFFDSYLDPHVRGGETPYMLAFIAPRINYFESLRFKTIFQEISALIKEKKEWDIKDYWEAIINARMGPKLKIQE
jgi:CheY-like chemotaxis protein